MKRSLIYEIIFEMIEHEWKKLQNMSINRPIYTYFTIDFMFFIIWIIDIETKWRKTRD
jgi:hypothetical protein